MLAQLTGTERQRALLILLVLAVFGLALGVAGRDDPVGAHGFLIMLALLGSLMTVFLTYYANSLAIFVR